MENCALNISEVLSRKKYNVTVFTSNIGANKKTQRLRGLRIHFLKAIEAAHTPIIFPLLGKLLFISRKSIIHLHIAQALTPEIVYFVSKIRKIPYIAHIHLDVDPSGGIGFLLAPYKKYFLSRVLLNASKVICLTEEQKIQIAKKYKLSKSKITVIPNGVDQKYFIKRTQTLRNNFQLLYIGRLSAQKNLELLINAMLYVKNKVTLNIVGEGEEREKIEKFINEKKLKNVYLHGKKTGQELLRFYGKADLFLISSKKEGFSLSMLEAMAAGIPIIASSAPGIDSVLDGCGVVVKNATPRTFAQNIDTLLSNKQKLRYFSSTSIKRAKRFSWIKTVNNIEKVYQSLDL
jgi:rhamnosyl/mannosyltransferase